MGLTYRDSGVDLDVYAQAMQKLPHWIDQTKTNRVMPLAGGFAGLFRLMGSGASYKDPVLVSGTDGVGTKLKIASLLGKYDTVGIDLVAMCVNDCLCIGAEPLFFLDYIALPSDDPVRLEQLVKGVSQGCVQSEMALLGGETAIMPAVYAETEFDMAGFAVAVVEKEQIIDGTKVQDGDVVLGISSNGLHSNGFSLVRKIVFEHAGLSADQPSPFGEGTLGEALLTPTRIYAPEVKTLMQQESLRQAVHGIVHVTGGGLDENIIRILPEGVSVQIQTSAWTPHPVFPWLQELGSVETEEMYRVFNMGIGLILIVDAQSASEIQSTLGEEVIPIGKVVAGEKSVKVS